MRACTHGENGGSLRGGDHSRHQCKVGQRDLRGLAVCVTDGLRPLEQVRAAKLERMLLGLICRAARIISERNISLLDVCAEHMGDYLALRELEQALCTC